MSREEPSTSSGGREPKVQRVTREYELEGMGDWLATQWQGDDGPRQSLRELADEFNRAVLEAALRAADERPLDGEVANLYRLLTDEGVGTAQRTEAETKLERNGLDPDQLRADFVSHQAIHTYLREHRHVQLSESQNGNPTEQASQTIQRMSGRLQSITERALERLTGDELTLDEPDVLVSVQVYCDECGRQFDVEEVLERGGCDCAP